MVQRGSVAVRGATALRAALPARLAALPAGLAALPAGTTALLAGTAALPAVSACTGSRPFAFSWRYHSGVARRRPLPTPCPLTALVRAAELELSDRWLCSTYVRRGTATWYAPRCVLAAALGVADASSAAPLRR